MSSIAQDERRAAPRTPRKSKAELLLCPSTPRTAPIEAMMEDYSDTGIGLVCEQSLPVGQKYVVREPTITRGGSVLYTVVRCNRIMQGLYNIGLHMTPCDDASVRLNDEARTTTKTFVWVHVLVMGCMIAAGITIWWMRQH